MSNPQNPYNNQLVNVPFQLKRKRTSATDALTNFVYLIYFITFVSVFIN